MVFHEVLLEQIAMKFITFEEFLQEQHAKQYIKGGGSDTMQEDYERWIDDKDAWEMYVYATAYGSHLKAINS